MLLLIVEIVVLIMMRFRIVVVDFMLSVEKIWMNGLLLLLMLVYGLIDISMIIVSM